MTSDSPIPGHGTILETHPQRAAHARWLTGAGPGALSVVELSGTEAWSILRAHFRCAKGTFPAAFQPGLARLGSLVVSSTPGDQLLLVCRQKGDCPTIELQGHHGLLADSHLQRTLESIGFSFAPREESEPLLSLVGQRDAAMREVPNRPSLKRLLHWADECWPKGLQKLTGLLRSGNDQGALEFLNAQATWRHLGTHLCKPFRIVLAGPPNAGKSSLLNRLLGYERALVSPVAGTTRDLVRDRVAYEGWVFELVDTAGLRQATDHLEVSGMELTRQAAQGADLVVWLVDPQNPTQPSPELAPGMFLATKADLNPEGLLPAGFAVDLQVSSQTGQGIEDLLKLFVDRLVGPVPPPDALVPFSPSLLGCLDRLSNLIQKQRTAEAHPFITQLLSSPESKVPG